MSNINEFKKRYLQKLASTKSFSDAWQVWEPEIKARLSDNPTGSEILDLGDSLSNIFQANAISGRGQSSLSGGGAAWECLISWYLNLICWDIPVMVSGTITDASGRTLSGQTVEAFVISVSHIPLLSIGFNCALGADQLLPYLRTLSQATEVRTSAHPNAGLPNAFGAYDQTPEEMGALITKYLEENLINIIGGCCGSTPDHIAQIAAAARLHQPRKIQQISI